MKGTLGSLLRGAVAAQVLTALVLAGCAPAAAKPAASAPPGGRERPFRVTAALRQDLGLVSGRDVCTKEAQLGRGFGCFRENGTQYHGTPLPERTPSPARLETATTRALAGLDYLVLENVTAGARLGVVVRGLGPRQDGAAAPVPLLFHGEARAAYWFGAAPFAGDGLRLGVFLAGGIAQVDSAFRVRVEEDTSVPPPVVQLDNPASQTLDVYRKSGTGFAGGGVTVAYAFLRRAAVFAEVMAIQLFPSEGTAFSPVLGYEHGF